LVAVMLVCALAAAAVSPLHYFTRTADVAEAVFMVAAAVIVLAYAAAADASDPMWWRGEVLLGLAAYVAWRRSTGRRAGMGWWL
jgi:hypothetical protein